MVIKVASASVLVLMQVILHVNNKMISRLSIFFSDWKLSFPCWKCVRWHRNRYLRWRLNGLPSWWNREMSCKSWVVNSEWELSDVCPYPRPQSQSSSQLWVTSVKIGAGSGLNSDFHQQRRFCHWVASRWQPLYPELFHLDYKWLQKI